MKKRALLILSLLSIALVATPQKSRVASVIQLIESEKFDEAKEAVELAISNDHTIQWPRTYYAKGLLCQKAFESGFDKNDIKKLNLYPDQLFLAYESYEKALRLNSKDRLKTLISQQYIALANDFQKLGSQLYGKKDYVKAARALEHALFVSKSPLLSVSVDTNLIFNTALAAFESKNWEKAISYLTGLNTDNYGTVAALLLFQAYMESGDSIRAEEVLQDGIERYSHDVDIVLQLVDLLAETNRTDLAISLLDSEAAMNPGNYVFPWTKGLLKQRMNAYLDAIECYTTASLINKDEVMIYYNMGICYYNIGAELDETARNSKSNIRYREEKAKAQVAFNEAVTWLEKAHEMNPSRQQTTEKLYELYNRLRMREKLNSLE